MTDGLVAFLRARLDEDEQMAREAAKHCGALIAGAASKEHLWRPPYDGSAWASDADHVYAVDPRPDQPRAEIADFGYSAFMLTPHIQNHSPARVLAEVDAKRRIVQQYEDSMTRSKALRERAADGTEDEYQKAQRLNQSVQLLVLHGIVKLLALPYRDHPNYRPEWAPEA